MPFQLPITNHSRVGRKGARKGSLEYGADTGLLFFVGLSLGGEGVHFFICFVGCFLFICFVFCLLFISLLCYRPDLPEVTVCG